MSYLKIKVQTNAKQSGVVNFIGGVLKVRVRAVPVDGKANLELVDLLGKILKLDSSEIRLVRGFRSRDKLVELKGISDEEIGQRISINSS
jgi:uncharacterized protein (TIGR00251 family)|tara:strand:+ start:88 stop:357 length:270 start_codon:yes stop_codon:yes gene_type:complete